MIKTIIDIGFLALALIVMALTLWVPRRSLKTIVQHDHMIFSTVADISGDLFPFIEDQIRIMPEAAEMKEVSLIEIRQQVTYMKNAVPLSEEYMNRRYLSFNSFAGYVMKLQKLRKAARA